MKYFIEDTTLTAIGDAVRAKGNTSDLIKVSELADAITNLPSGGGGDIEVEPIVLSNSQSYGCGGELAGTYLDLFGDTVSTKDITNASNMFYGYTAKSIPFDINFKTGLSIATSNMFDLCENLETLPKLLNLSPSNSNYMFSGCYRLRTIPDDFCDTWDWSERNNATSAYSSNSSYMFNSCYSLRHFPKALLANQNPVAYYGYTYFSSVFSSCYVLDEFDNLPLPYTATYTSNLFSRSFDNCSRASKLTFETNDDSSVKVMPWKSQTIDLTYNFGYAYWDTWCYGYNSGITADKRVKDDATYQALKNDPDWFSTDINYSRYNHDSAVNTINSLPDTSAYLATAGGTNTIKFKGASGSLTDGGAINTLTEEEIAVATAKGWTIALV